MSLHKLKIWPEYFTEVDNGNKPFEIRKSDRDYKVGDELTLNEYCPNKEDYTGRFCSRVITYVLKGGSFGLDSDYVVLGLKKNNKIVESVNDTSCGFPFLSTDEKTDFILDQLHHQLSRMNLSGESGIKQKELLDFISVCRKSIPLNKEMLEGLRIRFKETLSSVLKQI